MHSCTQGEKAKMFLFIKKKESVTHLINPTPVFQSSDSINCDLALQMVWNYYPFLKPFCDLQQYLSLFVAGSEMLVFGILVVKRWKKTEKEK